MKKNKDVVGKFINDMIVGGLVTLAFCVGVKVREKYKVFNEE